MRISLALVTVFWAAAPALGEMDGKNLFVRNCLPCHGEQGLGDGPAAVALDPPPRNLTVRPYKNGCGPGAIFRTITEAVEGTDVAPFAHLSAEERWELARYVRGLQQGRSGNCCGGCGR